MKNQVLTNVIAIGFAAVLATTPALAQNNHTATIPFSFNAGGAEYPSGTYEISRLGTTTVLKMTNVDTRAARLVAAPRSPSEKTRRIRSWSSKQLLTVTSCPKCGCRALLV